MEEPLVIAAAFGAALERVGAGWAVGGSVASSEQSDRQWRDILGIVALQGPRLDLGHLTRWATDLGVTDLLSRALQDDTGGV